MTISLSIGIVGGGLGGLTLASVLLNEYHIKSTIFELEASLSSRSQGGTLDLHKKSGQHALKKAGLLEEFKKHARYEAQEMRVTGKTTQALVHYADYGDDDKSRPEIDRKVLRQILIDSLPNDIIQWGKKVTKVEPSHDEMYSIILDDGTSQTFDLVVGADGAWSKVRSQLSLVTPEYTGVKSMEAIVPNVDQDYPESAKFIGQGNVFAMANNKALLCQRNGDGTIRVYITLRAPLKALANIDYLDHETTKAFFLQEFTDWDEPYKDLIRNSQPGIAPRDIFILPPDHQWKTRTGITLLGDAAHLMTPYAGQGANMAMLDGANLADAIAKVVYKGHDLTASVEEYEHLMFKTAGKHAAESAQNLESFISKDAPQSAVGFFEKLLLNPL
ncbi:hypothetical protein NQZ79_g7348 [Umbelopsis isabellina]|nr:hypothetical protein NQZ79_g7348 [Umbelopsis isabellina]